MMVEGTPITRYWLIPTAIRPKMFTPHPMMSSDEIRERTQRVWDRFYNLSAIWKRSSLHSDPAGSSGVRAIVEAVSTDVCGDRNLDRQRPPQEGENLGAMDRPANA